jgi:hypothetical protein
MATAQQLHDAALKLMGKLERTQAESDAAETTKGYNERRKATVVEFKTVLAEMDAAFNRGERVGGCASMKDYCKTYKPQGMVTYARVRQILTGTSGNEGKVKSLDLKVGDTITIELLDDNEKPVTRQFRILRLPEGLSELYGSKIDRRKIRGDIRVKMIEEPAKEEAQPAPAKVLHEGHPDKVMQTFCGKNWFRGDLAKSKKDVTCPRCLKKIAAAAERDALQKEFLAQPAETAVVNFDEFAAAKKATRQPKTHALSKSGNGLTRCRQQADSVQIAAGGEEPTCRNCATSIDRDFVKQIGEEFDKLVTGANLTKSVRRNLWHDFTNAKRGYVCKDGATYVPDSEAAARIAADPLILLKAGA